MDNINKFFNEEDPKRSIELYNALAENDSLFRNDKTLDQIIPKLFALCEKRVLQKHILYLCLLSNENTKLVHDFINYEKTHASLDNLSATNVFEYCYFKHRHWFLQVLEKYNDLAKTNFSEELYQKILILKLIEITNNQNVNLDEAKNILNCIDISRELTFVRYYVTEAARSIKLATILNNLTSLPDNRTFEALNFITTSTLLEASSKYVDLFKIVKWENFHEVLHFNEEYVKVRDWPLSKANQADVYKAFIIIFDILSCLNICESQKSHRIKHTDKNITDIIQKAEAKLMSITSAELQLEILYVIFSILFVQKKHLKIQHNDSKGQDHFLCDKNDVRIILQFLKSVCELIMFKNAFARNSEEYKTFIELSKYIKDTVWRFELVTSVKNFNDKENYELTTYMLAPPDSLLNLCMKHGDFDRSRQVIQIFGLQDSYLAYEIWHTLLLSHKRAVLKDLEQSDSVEEDINRIIEKFFMEYKICAEETQQEFVRNNMDGYNLSHFDESNLKFMDIFDLTITQQSDSKKCRALMNISFKNYSLSNDTSSDYSAFCNRLKNVFTEVADKHNLSVVEILLSPSISLNKEEYKSKEEFYVVLDNLYSIFEEQLETCDVGVLNNNHAAHKTYESIGDACENYIKSGPEKAHVLYLQKLFVYLKAFSKVLYIEQNNSSIVSQGRNTSYFELLQHNRALLMGRLLFENKMDPSEFEQYFSKLKLDLLYHIIGNCFPTINLHKHENISDEELYVENKLCEPTQNIITYIQKRNWLLAFILIDMYKINTTNIDLSEARLRIFCRYMRLNRVQNLKIIFNNNELITGLQNEISSYKVLEYIDNLIVKENVQLHDSPSASLSNSIETAEEMFEDRLKVTDWKYLYSIVDSIPENQLKKIEQYQNLKNFILVNLVTTVTAFEPEYFRYIKYISSVALRINTMLSCFKSWPVKFCIDLLKSELTMFEDRDTRNSLELWLEKLGFYERVIDILKVNSWYDVHKMCATNCEEVLKHVLLMAQIDVLLKYLSIFKPEQNQLSQIDVLYFATVFESDVNLVDIRTLLEMLPPERAVSICYNLIKLLKRINYMQFCIDYLLEITNEETDILKNVKISLKILSCFPQHDQEQLWCIVDDPASILEVFIMNTKLDKLGSVLSVIKQDLLNNEGDDNCLSYSKVDVLLRKYAEKSLDFHVIVHPEPRLLRTPENKLLQSLDSLLIGANGGNFVMPAAIPEKNEWIPNNEVLECMCCQQSTFSMFNRRHHCRRCGRVVCYNCSQRRMLVPTYGDILVRVCINCYDQTHDGSASIRSEASTRSNLQDFWTLTDDPENNKIVREEFAYEYAPSVSLCLAVLKYHSKTPEYPKFLLNQCQVMIKFLQPVQEAAREIDYRLVIKMLKSLAVAAKVLCSTCSLHSGSSLADKILSQVDLLSLLVDRGCLGLLPMSTQQECTFIDSSALRKLRDKLLECEQWNLALEVSTKAGLDNTGVFVAWGKSCLKAGSLQIAREKFQRCFGKIGHYESSEYYTSFDYGESSKGHKLHSTVPENKPSKNPPLLNDIINILVTNTRIIDRSVIRKLEDTKSLSASMSSLTQSVNFVPSSDPAVCILNKLKNLEAIVAGNYFAETEISTSNRFTTDKRIIRPNIDPLFYNECIYYLKKYGTHFSLLEFYIKHGEFSCALTYILDHRLGADVFTEVYMMCLKEGLINIFQEYLVKMDSSLEVWKNYLIQICRFLEKQNMLNSLYQLQRFMGDYIRAAMTCIRFYRDGVTRFNELLNRFNYLEQAEEHLRQDLEQQQWIDVATVRKKSMDSAGSFEEKSLSNPALVMRMNPKLIEKHITTISREKEIVKFLAECESAGRVDIDILNELVPKLEDTKSVKAEKIIIPTQFDSIHEKIQLAVLAVVCSESVDVGFKVACRIIEENKIKPLKVYCLAGNQLAKSGNYTGISQLVRCIKSIRRSDTEITDMCDETLSLAVRTLIRDNVAGAELENLIKLITDKGAKISAYIEAKQLKSAYFLAVKYKRMSDVRKIMREAELLNFPSIKSLCQKTLLSHAQSSKPKT